VIRSAASALYGTAATWRRRWYAGHPSRRRRLERPVISVGNLNTGGSGKTPLVAHSAARLAARGERPAILSRGYARTSPTPGVTIVSDGAAVLASLEHSGDEPLMLARALPGVAVMVAANRYEAGRVAESTLGATVHVLDDGFQHLGLERDVDLLIAGAHDLSDRVLPAGRLREPLTAAAAADARLGDGSGPAGDDQFSFTSAPARLSSRSPASRGRIGFSPTSRGAVCRRGRGWCSAIIIRTPTPTSPASPAPCATPGRRSS
jgi:tetraacyldisaccharide 4'-kinase